jgi:MerR family transcriptional regulator, light-induced transcriptional regulator
VRGNADMNAVTPERDDRNRRIYSTKDVEKIKLLWALVQEGHSIGLIANYSVPKLKTMLKATLSPQAPLLSPSEPALNTPQKYLGSMLSALNRFNLEGLHQVLQRARIEISTKEIVFDLIVPLLKEVGVLYGGGRLSVSQEHLLSALLRDYLGSIHQSLSPYDISSRHRSKKILLTTREGDIHEFHILMAAILANVYKFQTYYLGPNLPVQDLIACCERLNPDFLILGFIGLPSDKEFISPKKYLLKLDKALPRNVTFCYGGKVDLSRTEVSKDREMRELTDLNNLDQFLALQSNL